MNNLNVTQQKESQQEYHRRSEQIRQLQQSRKRKIQTRTDYRFPCNKPSFKTCVDFRDGTTLQEVPVIPIQVYLEIERLNAEKRVRTNAVISFVSIDVTRKNSCNFVPSLILCRRAALVLSEHVLRQTRKLRCWSQEVVPYHQTTILQHHRQTTTTQPRTTKKNPTNPTTHRSLPKLKPAQAARRYQQDHI
jgi:hypothetical protein